MHVVMLSDSETGGGAAQAASRLAEGLRADHRVTRCVLYPRSEGDPRPTVQLGQSNFVEKMLAPFTRRWKRRFPRWVPAPSTRRADRELDRTLSQLRPDIINVHNIHGGVRMGWSVNTVRIAARHAPVVWTLHDMWSFTGRCAYAHDCRKFETGCDASCPTANEYPVCAPSRIRGEWEERRRLFEEFPGLAAVTPSRWLAGEARRGLWGGHRVEAIPLSLPLDLFRPIDRAAARASLGIEASATVVLVCAHHLSDPRKGGLILPQVWQHVRRRPLTVVTMGAGELKIEDPNIRVVPLGWVTDAVRQALIYNVGDVLLHAAPVDNFPCVVMEALACGTPAVAFPIGGVPELVMPGQTGWLAAEKTPADLARTLDLALADLAAGHTHRTTCRQHAEREFAGNIQAGRYSRLFTDLLPRRAAA